MLIKKDSSALNLVFLMVDSTDHVTGKTGRTPTVTLSKNGGTFAAAAGTVTEIGGGLYKVAAHASDSDTLGSLALHAEATDADPVDMMHEVVAFNPLDVTGLGLSHLDADISSRSSHNAASVAALILASPSNKIATNASGQVEVSNADGMLDGIVEGTLTLKNAMRIVVAVLSGKISGADTDTVSVRNYGDTTDLIVATVDADGNRTAVAFAID